MVASTATADPNAAPCRSLYLRNLPDKIPKPKLRELLHAAASPHGSVTWISAPKTVALRGQAFLTFEDLSSATAALRAMHGAEFVGKTLSVAYARQVSDKANSDPAGARRKRAQEREEAEMKDLDPEPDSGRDGNTGAEPSDGGTMGDTAMIDVEVAAPEQAPPVVPNKILFAEGLPESATANAAAVLADLFGRFSGFVEVRSHPGRKDIAFVEYDSEADAAVALSGLSGHNVGQPPQPMVLSYAKR